MTDALTNYYEKDAARFWDPSKGMTGRDVDCYPLFDGLSGKVLEYGCGSGSLIVNLAREKRFPDAVGVDISTAALNKIRASLPSITDLGNLSLVQPEGDRLPQFHDNTFDVIVSVATIEHVVDMYGVLDELYRVAKPGAHLICSVPNLGYIKHIIHLFMGKQPATGSDLPVSKWREDGWDGMHLHTFTLSSFHTLLSDCGWEPIKDRGCGERLNWTGLGYLRRNYPRLWSGEIITLCRRK